MAQVPFPTATSTVLRGDIFTTQWFQYFWNQFRGAFPIPALPVVAPPAPTSGFVIYCDAADGKLKARASSGTITTLANP